MYISQIHVSKDKVKSQGQMENLFLEDNYFLSTGVYHKIKMGQVYDPILNVQGQGYGTRSNGKLVSEA